MSDRENCRLCGEKRPADAPSGLCPACLLKAGMAEEKTAAHVPTVEQPGTIVAGRYKLLEQIGEGGMGEVWVADQLEPIKRRVALKLIKSGMDSRSVLGRFEAERQALAVMDHPNIAKVLDAGAAADGRPYFVMELVKGTPITEFCDARRLTPQHRLELFVPVCQAIQHAHHKGIIHRDIKPSNVLVALHDEMPVAKVIDFGVAKAVGQQLTEKTIYTGFGALVGTPAYMAPEQATFNQLDVDTRADVYALGVLLYELLAGSPPIEKERLKQAALDEVLRIVRDEEPPRPSQRLSTSEAKASIAATRQSDPARLSALMKGEIDWIVMKALEKDRTRRYDTANGLARDIQRYLAGDSVEACPPTLGYRVRKFVHKYKKGLATAAAIVALLVAGVVVSTLLAVWATSAEREANRQRIASDQARQEALGARVEADRQRDEARATAYATGIGLAQRAWEDNDVIRARELLEGVPREVAGRDLRGFEWDYLSRLFHPEERTLTGHEGVVSSVAFSPDGRRLVSVSNDGMAVGTVKIWDGATGKELFALKGHDAAVSNVAFSPDGRRMAWGVEDRTVRVCDSATGKELFALKGHAEAVNNVAFSPDGKRLATGSYDGMAVGAVKVWDGATGKELSSPRGHTGGVSGVTFSPDGSRLASASYDGTVRIFDSATGEELFALKGHAEAVYSVAFSPDGSRLATGSSDSTVKIWDSVTGKELLALMGHIEAVNNVVFSPDGKRLASRSSDVFSFGAVKVWDSATGKELFSPSGHAAGTSGVAFSPDGSHLASWGWWDNRVKILDSVTGKELFTLKSHTDPIASVAFSPDGQHLASGGWDRTVKIWDTATRTEPLSPEGTGDAMSARGVAFSPDGLRLASGNSHGGGAETVNVWDGVTGTELLALDGHSGSVMSVAFSPDGKRLASGSTDSAVKLWDSVTGKELFTFKGHSALVCSVAFSPDGRCLATGSNDRLLKLWDSVTGKERLTLKGHAGDVNSVSFSADGSRLASGSGDRTAKLWDSATGTELRAFKGHGGNVNSVAFSPDGSRIASGSDDRTVKLWDTATGQELFALRGHGDRVWSVAFSPDGRRVASGSLDKTVKIWDTATGKELLSLKSHAGRVLGMGHSPVGRMIPGTRAFASDPGDISSVAFSPDGNRLAAGTNGIRHPGASYLTIWEASIPPEVLDRRAAHRLVADLFRQRGRRADVLEWLRTVPGMSPSRRQEAITAAQTYPEGP